MSSHRLSLLVVEDERALSRLWTAELGDLVEGTLAHSLADARVRLQGRTFDAILLDLHLPDGNGLELLRELREQGDRAAVIILTGNADLDSAIRALQLGAFDFMVKPFKTAELEQRLTRVARELKLANENLALRQQLRTRRVDSLELIGTSPALADIRKLIARAAPAEASILIEGETGTGKEIAARLIHANSARRDAPFVPVNCAALPRELADSEVFGHRKGAAGTQSDHRGLAQAAAGGTLFLDEVGDLPLDVQVKLLRVLQEREFERVGGTETIKSDVRVISATHRDLESLIAEGKFREDLYYRLNVFPITLPPLRDRLDDLPRLVEHFVAKFNRVTGKSVRGFEPAAIGALSAYHWPGNVRELENVVERAIIVARGPDVQAADLDFGRRAQLSAAAASAAPSAFLATGLGAASPGGVATRPLQARLQEQEKNEIVAAIERNAGNIAGAARALGINRSTLYYRLRKHGLEHLLPTKPDAVEALPTDATRDPPDGTPGDRG